MQKTEAAKPEALDVAAELDQMMRKLAQANSLTLQALQKVGEAQEIGERLQRLTLYTDVEL